MENILKPKSPFLGTHWRFLQTTYDALGYQSDWYSHPEGYIAISALEVTDGILRNETIPQYHISISKNGGRCDSQEAQFILTQFGLSDALEDNHVPSGIVRNFWQPVDENKIGMECHCVNEEPAIKEDKGDFIWRPASH